jgi:hypothetical protein
MFDPATLGSQLQPGDKSSMTFHRAKSDAGSGSFIQNAQNAGLVPNTQATPSPAGGAPAMAPMGAGMPDQRALLVAAMRRRFGLA